jgi:hypothetical protein
MKRFILLGVVAVAGLGEVVHQLWNHLMPGIFGLGAIGYWQALGLLVLGRLLFGGFGRRGGGRLGRMTPEERERFRMGMASRACARS